MSGGADWLREQLFERRIVMLTGPLDHALATQVEAQLLALDGRSRETITLHVDSADGVLAAGFVVMDAIDAVRAPVHVLCRGQVGGPALGVVASADHRVATPHARFRLAQSSGRLSGRPDDIAAQNREQQDALWRFYAHLARATGRQAEEIAEDVRRGRFMDAQEAMIYGLIDEIAPAR